MSRFSANARVQALAGSTSVSQVAGPFTPLETRAIWVTLSGVWAGTVRILRSTDGGATKLPLTVAGETWATFSANANEPVSSEDDPGATYWIDATIASGTLTFRLAQ